MHKARNVGCVRIGSSRGTVQTIAQYSALLGVLAACASGMHARADMGGTQSGAQTPTQAQTQAQSQSQQPSSSAASAGTAAFEYEVASFKLNKDGVGGSWWSNAGDSLSVKNASLENLVLNAYGVRPVQLSGGPSWLDGENYDVEAKMDSDTADALKKLTAKQRNLALQLMLQKLLADRLKLVVRRDTKEMQVYSLVVAKDGPKLKQTEPDTVGHSSTMMNGGAFTMEAQGMFVSNIAGAASLILGRIVTDETGLKGRYDFKLTWAPEERAVQPPAAGSPDGALPVPADPIGAPSIFKALQEQLGLKLESGKGPVEIIVIEHVERPSGN